MEIAGALLLALGQIAGNPVGMADARDGELYIVQMAVPDRKRFADEWSVTTPGASITSTTELAINKPTFVTVVFGGCQADTSGNCHLSMRFRVLDPSGKVYDGNDGSKTLPAYEGKKPPSNLLVLAMASIGLRIEPGETLGLYTVQATVTDDVAKRSATSEIRLTTKAAERP